MNTISAELMASARSGDPEAQIALGREFEARSESLKARAFFAAAAKSGRSDALRLLATNLLTRKPIVEGDGVNMMRAAADGGDAEAMHSCAMLAAQDVSLPDRWRVAREILERSAAAGFELAQAELAYAPAVAGENAESWTMPSDSQAVSAPLRAIAASPRIGTIENFATPQACEWLIARARTRMARAEVYDPATGKGRVEQARSNSSAPFNIAESDLVLLALRERIAHVAELPLAGLEATAILHYSVGQQFEPHFDFLDADVPSYASEIAETGQRVATFLIYLNDGYEGGETEFPDLNLSFKGRAGDALLFWNVDPSGAPDLRTRHAGRPPTRGEKWILSQWLRQSRARAGPAPD